MISRFLFIYFWHIIPLNNLCTGSWGIINENLQTISSSYSHYIIIYSR